MKFDFRHQVCNNDLTLSCGVHIPHRVFPISLHRCSTMLLYIGAPYLRNSRAHTTPPRDMASTTTYSNWARAGQDFARSSEKRAARGKPQVDTHGTIRPGGTLDSPDLHKPMTKKKKKKR